MSNSNTVKSYILPISIFAIIWNGIGTYMYMIQAYRTESFKGMYTEDQLQSIYNMPTWATAAFAFAVFGGLLGSIALLMKRKIAYILFILSFIGIILQMYHNFFIANSIEVYGPGAAIMPIMVIIIGIFLIIYSKNQIKRGALA